MKKTNFPTLLMGFFLAGALWISGCGSDEINPEKGQTESPIDLGDKGPASRCGNSLFSDLIDLEGNKYGKVELVNDPENFWILVSLEDNAIVNGGKLFYGEIESLPINSSGDPDLSKFSTSVPGTEGDFWIYKLPLTELPECYVISLALEMTSSGGDKIRAWPKGKTVGEGFASELCTQGCTNISGDCDNGSGEGEFLTYTQKEWLTSGKDYLNEWFPKTFPNGLSIGCTDIVNFTALENMLALLPSTGDPKPLKDSLVNPETLPGNSLFGETVALTLNIGFDLNDPDFSKSKGVLKLLKVNEGPFAGWTVEDIFAEANSVLGGCASNYSPSQILKVVQSVNANYSGGKKSNGFLVCQDGN